MAICLANRQQCLCRLHYFHIYTYSIVGHQWLKKINAIGSTCLCGEFWSVIPTVHVRQKSSTQQYNHFVLAMAFSPLNPHSQENISWSMSVKEWKLIVCMSKATDKHLPCGLINTSRQLWRLSHQRHSLWNNARFINHFYEPHCEAFTLDLGSLVYYVPWLQSIKDIRDREENRSDFEWNNVDSYRLVLFHCATSNFKGFS